MALGDTTHDPQDWFSQQGTPAAGGQTQGTPWGTGSGPSGAIYGDPRGGFGQTQGTTWGEGSGPSGGVRDPAAITEAAQRGGVVGPGAAPGVDPYALIRQATQSLPPTTQGVDQLLATLRAQGIPATRATHANNTLASDDVIILPDGSEVDLISDVGGGGAAWRPPTGPTGQYDPNRSVVGPDGKLVKFADYLGQQGLPVPMAPLSGVGGGAGGADAALMSAPGFQFRIAEGQKALERSAAARGTLLTGGTLKGLTRYGQDYASNEYNNRYNQLMGLSSLGQGAAGQQANLSQNYANQFGTLNTNQANTGTNLITDAANARAASTVAGSQAYGNANQNAMNTAMQLYLLKQMQGGGQ